MKKKLFAVGLTLLLAVVLVVAMSGTGAWWTAQTQALDNEVEAAQFGMTIGDNGQQVEHGICSYTNMAPGDDPVVCNIPLENIGSIPINVVWSGFQLTGDSIMQDWVFVTDFADSNGTTHLADIMGFDTNADGKLSIKEASVAIGNGYFSDPNGVYGYGSVFLDPGQTGWVSLTLAFGAAAPNETIGKSVGFNWTLTGQQLPKNATP